jgi:hypothetical protein
VIASVLLSAESGSPSSAGRLRSSAARVGLTSVPTMEAQMALMLGSFQVADYDAWKQMFDSDPLGRKQAATGHRIFRSVENPNHIFVSIGFATEADAKAFRDRLLGSDEVMSRMTPVQPPTVVDTVDEATY